MTRIIHISFQERNSNNKLTTNDKKTKYLLLNRNQKDGKSTFEKLTKEVNEANSSDTIYIIISFRITLTFELTQLWILGFDIFAVRTNLYIFCSKKCRLLDTPIAYTYRPAWRLLTALKNKMSSVLQNKIHVPRDHVHDIIWGL